MNGPKTAIAIAVTTALIAALLLLACGHRSARVLSNVTNPQSPPQQQPQDDSANSGPIPGVFELDGRIAVNRTVSAESTVTSQGLEAYTNGQTGTNGTSGLNVETSGTSLTLRAYTKGEYAYAVYGQAIGIDSKPLKTFIDSNACEYGGALQDIIPLSYYVGIADYTIGAWRWFGPFGAVDVMVTVNSEALKSRFKSPSDNYYLSVLASNGSKAASALPAEGSVAGFPIDLSARSASAEGDDPGGLTIEQVITTVDEDLLTKPVMLSGLHANADTSGVNLSWDVSLDPDVDLYQVFRADPDNTDTPQLLQSVLAPTANYSDTTGTPGKNYCYLVRAHNNAGYGGASGTDNGRLLIAPPAAASRWLSDYIDISWPVCDGAEGYAVLRSDTEAGWPVSIAEVDASELSYEDYEPDLDVEQWYRIKAIGEDFDSDLSYDYGLCGVGIRHVVPANTIEIFAPNKVNVGDTFTATVYVEDTANFLGNLNTVELSYPSNLSADENSWNLGAPFGAEWDADGIWSGMDGGFLPMQTSLMFETPGLIQVRITPLGAASLPAGSSGALFNFKFVAKTAGLCNLAFNHANTYYSEPDSTEHFFGAEVGAEVLIRDESGDFFVTGIRISAANTANTDDSDETNIGTEYYVAPGGGGDTYGEVMSNELILMDIKDVYYIWKGNPYGPDDQLPTDMSHATYDDYISALRSYMSYSIFSTANPVDPEAWTTSAIQPPTGIEGQVGPNDDLVPPNQDALFFLARMSDNDYTQGSVTFDVSIIMDITEDTSAPELFGFDPLGQPENQVQLVTIYMDWGSDEVGDELPIEVALYNANTLTSHITFSPAANVETFSPPTNQGEYTFYRVSGNPNYTTIFQVLVPSGVSQDNYLWRISEFGKRSSLKKPGDQYSITGSI